MKYSREELLKLPAIDEAIKTVESFISAKQRNDVQLVPTRAVQIMGAAQAVLSAIDLNVADVQLTEFMNPDETFPYYDVLDLRHKAQVTFNDCVQFLKVVYFVD